MIDFQTIPAAIRVPGQMIEFDASRAVSGLPAIRNTVLLIGQRLAAGASAALVAQPIVEPGQAVALFGRGSMLARMAAAYKAADRWSDVQAIALDDVGGGVAATGTVTVTGPATAAGTIALMIAGVAVPVVVASGDSAATIAGKIVAAVTARPDLPVTAAAAAAVVTLTCRHKGTVGNQIDLRHSHYAGEALPAGVGLVIVAMANGAGDPDIDAIWPVIGDAPYRTIVVGLCDAATMAKVKAELDDRWGAERMLESVAYGARAGTQAEMSDFGDGLNSELASVLGIGKSPTWPCEAGAIYAATCGYYTAIDPARPVQTLELPGLIGPKAGQLLTRAEREQLLHDGIATMTVDAAGVARIERAVTTYRLDAGGLPDVAWLDLETVTTMAYLRASLRARIAAKFPRHKLADDGYPYGAGQAVVTPSILRAELLALAREWETAGLVEGIDQFAADLIVERDANDPNRINALVPPDVVNQFRSFAAAIQFRL